MQKTKFSLLFISFLGLTLITIACRINKVIIDTTNEENHNIETNVEVASNERGVLFRKFSGGVDTSIIFLPGKYSISSFDRLILYNIDLKTKSDIIYSVAKGGDKVKLNIKYSFKPTLEKIALLHYYIGSNYPKSIVEVGVNSVIEEYFKEFFVNEISLNQGIEQLEKKIFYSAKKRIAKDYVDLDSLQIVELQIE